MGRRVLNRKELRADFDAAERQKPEDEDVVDEESDADEDEEEDDDKGEESDEGEAEAEGDGEAEGEGDEDDEEGAKPAKKKKKVAKVKVAKVAKPKRTRTAKVVRMRLVWGVFNNSHQCVATYEYPKRSEAEAHAAKLTGDKKNTHFVQPVKEPIDEKKDKV